MKQLVTYMRSNREPHVLAARIERKVIPAMDDLLERLGFQRVGKQDELVEAGLVVCSKCGGLFDPARGGAKLALEAFCRPCIKRHWGGHK